MTRWCTTVIVFFVDKGFTKQTAYLSGVQGAPPCMIGTLHTTMVCFSSPANQQQGGLYTNDLIGYTHVSLLSTHHVFFRQMRYEYLSHEVIFDMMWTTQ